MKTFYTKKNQALKPNEYFKPGSEFSYSISVDNLVLIISLFGSDEAVRRITRLALLGNEVYSGYIENTSFKEKNPNQREYQFKFHTISNEYSLTKMLWFLFSLTDGFDEINNMVAQAKKVGLDYYIIESLQKISLEVSKMKNTPIDYNIKYTISYIKYEYPDLLSEEELQTQSEQKQPSTEKEENYSVQRIVIETKKKADNNSDPLVKEQSQAQSEQKQPSTKKEENSTQTKASYLCKLGIVGTFATAGVALVANEIYQSNFTP